MDILKTEGKGKARGVIHCFSYDLEAARKFYALGFLTSFTCNVTYKNAAALADVAANAPLDRIMLETDSPYLSPQSCRGKRNEPSRLVELAGFLSARRGIGREELEKQTSQNAMNLFGLALHE